MWPSVLNPLLSSYLVCSCALASRLYCQSLTQPCHCPPLWLSWYNTNHGPLHTVQKQFRIVSSVSLSSKKMSCTIQRLWPPSSFVVPWDARMHSISLKVLIEEQLLLLLPSKEYGITFKLCFMVSKYVPQFPWYSFDGRYFKSSRIVILIN